jgi:hypothetical protein
MIANEGGVCCDMPWPLPVQTRNRPSVVQRQSIFSTVADKQRTFLNKPSSYPGSTVSGKFEVLLKGPKVLFKDSLVHLMGQQPFRQEAEMLLFLRRHLLRDRPGWFLR